MEAIRGVSRSGFRAVVIFFLGLNIAWMEMAYNATLQSPAAELGWPPFDWYLTAVEWFWIHFALTGISAAVLIYTYHLWPVQTHERGGGADTD